MSFRSGAHRHHGSAGLRVRQRHCWLQCEQLRRPGRSSPEHHRRRHRCGAGRQPRRLHGSHERRAAGSPRRRRGCGRRHRGQHRCSHDRLGHGARSRNLRRESALRRLQRPRPSSTTPSSSSASFPTAPAPRPRSGFGCDGLTQYVFGQFGIYPAARRRQPGRHGNPRSRPKTPRPGDLVVWPDVPHRHLRREQAEWIDSPDWGRYVEHRAAVGQLLLRAHRLDASSPGRFVNKSFTQLTRTACHEFVVRRFVGFLLNYHRAFGRPR